MVEGSLTMYERKYTLSDGRTFQVRRTATGWEVQGPEKTTVSLPSFPPPQKLLPGFSTLPWRGLELASFYAHGKQRVVSWPGGALEMESEPLLDGESETGGKAKSLKLTMPGKVLEVRIKVGQKVKGGEGLIVVEAMKMENLLVAPASATIADVKVKVGDRLDAGAILVTFSEE
jgi:biotin carboxyl carrier protein